MTVPRTAQPPVGFSECEDRENIIEIKSKSGSEPNFDKLSRYSGGSNDPELLRAITPNFPNEDYIFFMPDKFDLPVDSQVLSISNSPDKNKKQYFSLPKYIDQSFWFPPVRDQGTLNSCAAFSAISLIEYSVRGQKF